MTREDFEARRDKAIDEIKILAEKRQFWTGLITGKIKEPPGFDGNTFEEWYGLSDRILLKRYELVSLVDEFYQAEWSKKQLDLHDEFLAKRAAQKLEAPSDPVALALTLSINMNTDGTLSNLDWSLAEDHQEDDQTFISDLTLEPALAMRRGA